MAGKTSFFGSDQSEALRIQWTGGYKFTHIFFNGNNVATIDKLGLKNGRSVLLPNGKELTIRLRKSVFAILETKIDGQHIPKSFGDPIYLTQQIFWLLAVLGALNFVIGIGISFAIGGEDALLMGGLNAAFGITQFIAGIGIKKQKFGFLILATFLMSADLLLSIYYASGQQSFVGNVPMIIKATFLLYIMRGFYAFKELKNETLTTNNK